MPEFWGRPSPYTEGTNFLGTPKDHLEVRPRGDADPQAPQVPRRAAVIARIPYLPPRSS